MKSCLLVSLRVVLTVALLSSFLIAQRSDRGIITGVVTDATGSSVPAATVKVRNEGTGVETTLTSNDAGAYTTPPLVLGAYSVTVDHPGFKTSLNSGIMLQGAETIRKDVTLAVGSVSESVEVKAGAEQLEVTTPDVSHTVDQKYYNDLPVITGADVRLAESLLQIQPGYLPQKPNGDPMFRGSQFNSRINGGQTMATENFFDGAAFGYMIGHQQSHESGPPVDSIQEVKVITTTYAAQYGHTAGGFIEYTSKSGTNQLHGSAYEYLGNDALNARGYLDHDCNDAGQCTPRAKTPYKNNSFGFTLGGPAVIPKVYDGHNKTFFFTNIDWTRLRSGVLPGFGNTTPTDAFKNGDFSSLLTTDQIATDALGRPVFKGQIFNPATTTTVGGIPVRDPYPGNIIPTNDPNRSVVASRIAALMVHPDRPGNSFNVAGNPAGDQTWLLNARTILFRVDHSFTPNFRYSTSFYWGHRPSIRNCGEVGGCVTQFDGGVSPEKNNQYIGDGFYQRITTHHAHNQFDWIIRPNLLNHTTVAWDRWFMGGNNLATGVGWTQLLWNGVGTAGSPGDGSGILEVGGGPPHIEFHGNIPYNHVGDGGWGHFGFQTGDRWQFSDDLSWVKGRHTIKVGFEYRLHMLHLNSWAIGDRDGRFDFNSLETAGYDAAGNNLNSSTGDPFASMLLGQVDAANQTIPVFPTFNERYMAPWINDEFKVTNRLTITLGLRFDYQFARNESKDQYSSFDANALQSPAPGDPQIPGALLYAGKGADRTGRRTFEKPKLDAWGPRLGFAYRLNDKTAIRGGYGIYYSGISFSQFMANPNTGFSASPLARSINNGQTPAFLLDSGFPQNVITFPPFISPTFANGTAPLAVAKNGLTLPRYQNFSLTVERQITNNMRLDVSYIGNRGTRLTSNWGTLGVDANMNNPSVLGLGAAVLNSPCNSTSCPAGITLPYPSFDGNVAQALRRYPQYQNILWRGVPTGNSIYHALETVLEQRLAHGLQFRVGYTYSRLNNDGAENAQGAGFNTGIQNPIDPEKGEWGLSADDVPHVFLVGYTWELPGGKKFKGTAGALLGGWNLSGALRYESGRPLNITMNNDLGGFLFNQQKRPNRVKGTNAVTSRNGNFVPGLQNYFNKAAWVDPGPLQFGNAPRRDGSVRGFPTYNEDVSIFKEFQLRERLKMRFTGELGNAFNRTDFCDPDSNFSAGSFGTVNTQCNQPRNVQFGLKFDF